MARPKKVVEEIPDYTGIPVVPTTIEKVSVDYGREDLNNIAKKLNEVIEYLNEKNTNEGSKDAQE